MKSLNCLTIALVLTATLGVCFRADADTLTGEFKAYFSQHEGTTESITIDLGAGPMETGPLTTTLDLTNPQNSFETFNFDTMTVREEVDTILTAPLFERLGIPPIRMHAVEEGTFEILSLETRPDGTFTAAITTSLNGMVVVPPGSPFEGWQWRNAKEQSVSAGGSYDPNTGVVSGTVTKTWTTKDASIVSPDPGGTVYPTSSTGVARLSSVPVPEPSTIVLLCSALAGLLLIRRRNR